ncbi:dihydropteroate synthase [Stenotrophobium rhamnosiphilum]|uniref:Dihydropteroate synthase n=2 Tax=Stenotrophobium rhamnosiphilum TaxID=2029166 RepID=A0A2T5MIX3_9GAMM|nr:dihydropteroate synthase [Stenotrophobium rhamnosiphilum]
MGVLNVTPDSFSDGGQYLNLDAAIARAREMVGEGAAIIDIGGESTRPGAQPVSEQEEIARVVPVIECLSRELDCVISIDTLKPAVMEAACAAGASMINDVNALQAPGAIEIASRYEVAVCLMHMQGEPLTMQSAPHYDDVLTEVRDFLTSRVSACIGAGISPDRIVVDPGIGFGKTLPHNLELLANLEWFEALNCPLLIGVSRKSMFKALLDVSVDQRLNAALSAAAIAVWQGAAIVRAHDVRATAEALLVAAALRDKRRAQP